MKRRTNSEHATNARKLSYRMNLLAAALNVTSTFATSALDTCRNASSEGCQRHVGLRLALEEGVDVGAAACECFFSSGTCLPLIVSGPRHANEGSMSEAKFPEGKPSIAETNVGELRRPA